MADVAQPVAERDVAMGEGEVERELVLGIAQLGHDPVLESGDGGIEVIADLQIVREEQVRMQPNIRGEIVPVGELEVDAATPERSIVERNGEAGCPAGYPGVSPAGPTPGPGKRENREQKRLFKFGWS